MLHANRLQRECYERPAQRRAQGRWDGRGDPNGKKEAILVNEATRFANALIDEMLSGGIVPEGASGHGFFVNVSPPSFAPQTSYDAPFFSIPETLDPEREARLAKRRERDRARRAAKKASGDA
jgi:hypothetical protein